MKLSNFLEYNLLTPIWIFISSVTSKTQRILEIMFVMQSQKCNKYIQVLYNRVILKFFMLINKEDFRINLSSFLFVVFFVVAHVVFLRQRFLPAEHRPNNSTWKSNLHNTIPCIIIHMRNNKTPSDTELYGSQSMSKLRERKRDSSHRGFLFGHTGSLKERNCN